jgi:hypothetical protein
MGGFGSGHRKYNKKWTVENCFILTISNLVPYFQYSQNCPSDFWWSSNNSSLKIDWQLSVDEHDDLKVWLRYPLDGVYGEIVDIIRVVTTTTPWGSTRYWFQCPLSRNGIPCHRRVMKLYLPPGAKYFGCRHCYELTYQSCQQKDNWFWKWIGAKFLYDFPGINARETQRLLEHNIVPARYQNMVMDDEIGEINQQLIVEESYLTREELCEKAGLDLIDFVNLENTRLLLPDKPGKYRPKLVGWGKKLAYLLKEGWEISEIKHWSQKRWKSSNPRQWPPDRNC